MPNPPLDDTHDPARRCRVPGAEAPGGDFPIRNLPWGAFSEAGGPVRIGVAIGDAILDATALEAAGRIAPGPAPVLDGGTLNAFMALPPETWTATRRALSDLLTGDPDDLLLVPRAAARMHLPCAIGGFTDFYASREHATNVGTMFRGADAALMPNWLHMPVGYNGRASTVVPSGTGIRRPLGQLKAPGDDAPRLGPTAKLDIELELGTLVGGGNAMGEPITVAQARAMIFGHVLLNDWSARDVQVWEYQPLGPFGAKAFGTTISPWIVTRDALAPFAAPTPERVLPLLPYLHEDAPGNYDLALEVDLIPAGGRATTIARTNQRHLYYSPAQQLVHHAVSGCAMRPGDLLGSGTISGPSPGEMGSLLELTWNGRDPVAVDGGARTFLQDGDTVVLRGRCGGADGIGFGDCAGTILPATEWRG